MRIYTRKVIVSLTAVIALFFSLGAVAEGRVKRSGEREVCEEIKSKEEAIMVNRIGRVTRILAELAAMGVGAAALQAVGKQLAGDLGGRIGMALGGGAAFASTMYVLQDKELVSACNRKIGNLMGYNTNL